MTAHGLFNLTHTRDPDSLSSSKSHDKKARHDMDEIANYTKNELYDRFANLSMRNSFSL